MQYMCGCAHIEYHGYVVICIMYTCLNTRYIVYIHIRTYNYACMYVYIYIIIRLYVHMPHTYIVT